MFTEKHIKILFCPIDKLDMKIIGKTVYCTSGHAFDVSKEGYINLLTSNKRFHKEIGDNKEMLLSRQCFLEEGYYDFLSEEINRMVVKNLLMVFNENTKKGVYSYILEMGSGTAFYLGRLKKYVRNKFNDSNLCYFGTDISKQAIKLSAKMYPDVSFLVADTYDSVPIKDNTITLILNIFSPRNLYEFKRLLREDGLLLIVIPNENHIHELINNLGLVRIESEKKTHIQEMFKESFVKIDESEIERKILMDVDSIKKIIKMGPNFSRFDSAMEQKVEKMGHMNVTISFSLFVYKKA